MKETHVVMLVLLIIFLPFIIGRILIARDEMKRKEVMKRIRPNPQPLSYEAYLLDEDDLLDNGEEYADAIETVQMTDKERREEFYRQQAELDADFLVGQLDDFYREIRIVDDDIERAERRSESFEQVGKYEAAKKEIKERDRLLKRRRTLEGQIHGTEKKLRVAQFKSGQKIYT